MGRRFQLSPLRLLAQAQNLPPPPASCHAALTLSLAQRLRRALRSSAMAAPVCPAEREVL
jgi:hypothetical protein